MDSAWAAKMDLYFGQDNAEGPTAMVLTLQLGIAMPALPTTFYL